jgi:hypothetical protein
LRLSGALLLGRKGVHLCVCACSGTAQSGPSFPEIKRAPASHPIGGCWLLASYLSLPTRATIAATGCCNSIQAPHTLSRFAQTAARRSARPDPLIQADGRREARGRRPRGQAPHHTATRQLPGWIAPAGANSLRKSVKIIDSTLFARHLRDSPPQRPSRFSRFAPAAGAAGAAGALTTPLADSTSSAMVIGGQRGRRSAPTAPPCAFACKAASRCCLSFGGVWVVVVDPSDAGNFYDV